MILIVPPYFGFSATDVAAGVGIAGVSVGFTGVCAGVGIAGVVTGVGAGEVAAFGPQETSSSAATSKIFAENQAIFLFISPPCPKSKRERLRNEEGTNNRSF